MNKSKHILTIVVLTLVSLPVWAQKESGGERLRDRYRQATDLYQKQKYAAAQQIFDQVVPASVDWLTASDAAYYAAVCSVKLDNNDAYYRLEEFLRIYPQSSRCNMARFYLGNFYYTRGDYERALSYYRDVNAAEVEFDHRSEYNFKMGYCYFQRGDTQRAAKLFSQQIEGQSKYRTSSLYYYAHIQYMNGQYELALKNFRELQQDRKFAKIAPSYIARIYYYLGKDDELLAMAPALLSEHDAFKKNEIHQMIGEIYFNRDEYAKALEQYREVENEQRKVESCTPQDNDYQVGYSYYMLGRYDEAVGYLSKKINCNDSVAQNALYVLGDAYVKLERKMDARSMFLQASKMDFNKKVKEDALFNYAKLSCELNQNAMGESIKSFEGYLKKYPKSRHKTEAEEILTELYCSTNNYKEAIRLLEQVPQRNARLEQAYQRALLNRGIELSNSGKESEGARLYEKAIKVNAVPKITADANYLLGEWQYRTGKGRDAERSLEKFLLSSYSKSSPYAADARYTYGYLLMKKKQYADAYGVFDELVGRLSGNDAKSVAMRNDACNRMGDCLYVQSRFAESIVQYDKVISANGRDADYATFQKALAYGAQGKNGEKLTYLNFIFERFDNSPLRSKAMLEIANTYMKCDNNEMAMTYYTNFIKQYPNSVYVKNALLNQGLIYYNIDRNNEALRTFDRLLTQYPGTDEARDALGTVKNIYIAQNRVDEYFDYVKRTTNVTVSSVEQDSTTFLAAKERYQEGDFAGAASAFDGYLRRFPSGLFALKAHYLLADCYLREQQEGKALPHYEAVAAAGSNQYSERSLLNAANIAFNMGNYAKAASLYERLCNNAESDNSLLQGKVGALRSAVAAGGQSDAVAFWGRSLLAEKKATLELREEASLALARSFFDNGRHDSAYHYYGLISSSSNGEYNGEARCRQAEILMLARQYDQAEHIIESIVADASSDYWLAYSFILWADIYYARGNSLQAKQTLQSIIDNYDGEALLAVARQKLDAILAAEQPAPPAVEDEELTIEL